MELENLTNKLLALIDELCMLSQMHKAMNNGNNMILQVIKSNWR